MAEPLIITVLRTAPWRGPNGRRGDYHAIHARWLHGQLRRHWRGRSVCLSDVAVPGVETLPLVTDWPGWWAKIEICRPDIAGDVLFLDLDTVVLADLEALTGVGKTTVLRDFYRGGEQIGSGLMYLTEADRSRIWQAFTADPEAHMRRCVTRECWGDQGFLQAVIGDTAQRWQDVLPGEIVSYKADLRRRVTTPSPAVQPAATVVCFHGLPRPWNVGHRWVPRMCA